MFDVRKDVLKFMKKHGLSYERVYQALGFNSRKTCFAFLHSKKFNRYKDLMDKFEKLQQAFADSDSEAK